MAHVIDTNVPLVVRFPEGHSEALLEACEELLIMVIEGEAVVTDAAGEIVEEYFHKLGRSGQPSLGDVFAKWVYDHRWNQPDLVVELQPNGHNRYATLLEDGEFDPSDRKFVAAGKVSGAPIHQATDTKWLDWGRALHRHGVEVRWVHEASIRAAYLAKFGREAP